ncbi:MAG: HupE/UreJ family protein, partial [Gemmatimonadetes bacterium]|nr:HupE/UreJ family protein [Gemmatimonadota bacterium]
MGKHGPGVERDAHPGVARDVAGRPRLGDRGGAAPGAPPGGDGGGTPHAIPRRERGDGCRDGARAGVGAPSHADGWRAGVVAPLGGSLGGNCHQVQEAFERGSVSVFTVYLGLGFEHLLDLQGYDHILFLAGLCAAYSLRRWRELLVLVTAFTIGHSVSLALATLRLVEVNTSLVEFLIPVTIVATAVINLVNLRAGGGSTEHAGARAPSGARARHARYAAALVFGLVHGLGFSNFLRLALGAERTILVPLLSFS